MVLQLEAEFPISGAGHLVKAVDLRAEPAISGDSCYVSGWGVQNYVGSWKMS